MPTLRPEQIEARVRELMTNDGDCTLPCWWSITPGVTSWNDAQSVLQPIAASISPYGLATSALQYADADFHGLPPDLTASSTLKLTFQHSGGIVQRIAVYGLSGEGYQLDTFLARLGEPEAIWLNAHAFTPEPFDPPMTLLLVYEEQGVGAVFSTESQRVGEHIEGCFDAGPTLWLWEGHKSVGLTELMALFDWGMETETLFGLDHATGTTIEEFYEASTQDDDVCVETPFELWP